MDELQHTRLTQSCAKVFVSRDYSEGIAVKFETKLPQELAGKVINLNISILEYFVVSLIFNSR